MTKERAIKEIKEIMNEVESTWLASDGGLTMAASDLLAFGNSTIKNIKKGRINQIMEFDPFDCSTGAEQDIICVAQQWAQEVKIRRRIEDRLRKDETFFERVKIFLEEPEKVAFLWGELFKKVDKHTGATLAIKISNMEEYLEKYREELEEAKREITHLAKLLYENDIRFHSEHPYAKKYSLASRAPKNMRNDLLRG